MLGVGYTGVASGKDTSYGFWENRDARRPFMIHAEVNCLSLFKRGECKILAVTLLPCSYCATMIAAYGIEQVIYRDEYERDDGAKKIFDFYRAVQRRPELSFDEMLQKQVEKGCPVEFKCFGFTEHPRSRDQDSDYYVSLINNAIQKLDEKHREPLTLFLNEGLEYTEIAKKLNCPVGTVMSRIFYARKISQKLLMPLKN